MIVSPNLPKNSNQNPNSNQSRVTNTEKIQPKQRNWSKRILDRSFRTASEFDDIRTSLSPITSKSTRINETSNNKIGSHFKLHSNVKKKHSQVKEKYLFTSDASGG